jgi:hypothetical protein
MWEAAAAFEGLGGVGGEAGKRTACAHQAHRGLLKAVIRRSKRWFFMEERDGHGRFVAGNPIGRRPKASSSARAVRRLSRREVISPGVTPLEFLLKKMRDEDADLNHRVAAAIACLPYCHARRRHDAVSFTLSTPTSAAEATEMLATIPARVASDGLDPQVAMAITASLKAYLEAFAVTGIEAKVRALIEARQGAGAEEEVELTPELEARLIDLRPPKKEDLQ